MKLRLPSEPKPTKLKAAAVLSAEREPQQADFKQVLLERQPEIQAEFVAALRFANSEGGFNWESFKKIARLLLLDQTVDNQLLPADLKQQVVPIYDRRKPILDTELMTGLIEGYPRGLTCGAWVQVFPEEADWVRLEDADLQAAIRQLGQGMGLVRPEQLVVNLMQIRPDQQAELRQLVDLDEFEQGPWSRRSADFEKLPPLMYFLEILSSVYLARPDARERFVLTQAQKDSIIRFSRQVPRGPGFESFLQYAAIVLGDDTELKSNGQIEIRFKPQAAGHVQPLPVRPLA